MTLQQLRYAIGISKVGSFNKAAESLFISQPSLTTAIHDLEDEIGITIFNRTSRGVTLTPKAKNSSHVRTNSITITSPFWNATARKNRRRSVSQFRHSTILLPSNPL
nr:LysR family transcriptional regulator [Fibrobacter sp.]